MQANLERYPSAPSNFWEWLLSRKLVVKKIKKSGFFEIEKSEVMPSYGDWRTKQAGTSKFRSAAGRLGKNPSSLSFECYSDVPHLLKSHGLYPVATGRGGCIVFDSSVFPAPFMRLNGTYWRKIIDIPVSGKIHGYENLRRAFFDHWNEQTFLKALHFCGAFNYLVKRICKADRYAAGPSGQLASSFPFFMKNSKKNKLSRFAYAGITDLDECLYPVSKDIVIPVEAKVRAHHDLSWHKLAFPCYRFIDNSKSLGAFQTGSNPKPQISSKTRIIPVYCMYHQGLQEAYLYLFRDIKVHRKKNEIGSPENGLVLNDRKCMTPKIVFRVDMKWIMAADA